MLKPPFELTPKRLEIADAALRIIETRGIAALTTSALATELGVSSGAPYRHFESREQILEAVVLRVEEMILGTFPPATTPPLDRIQALLLARVKMVEGNRGIGRLMVSEQFALVLPPSAAARLGSVVIRTRAFLLDALAEAQRAGAVRTDLTPKALLRVVFGLLLHLVHSQAVGQARAEDLEETRTTLLAILRPPTAA